MSDKIRETRTAAFAACPETGCDWSSFWRGWQAALAQQPASVVPDECDCTDYPQHCHVADGCKWMAERLADSAPAAPVAQEPVAWISVEDGLPKSGMTVLACYTNSHGKVRRIRAEYVASKSRELDDFCDPDESAAEYDEETDQHYWSPGWYECIDNWSDYTSLAVTEGDVTHWMPLPAVPGDTAPPAAEQPSHSAVAADMVWCACGDGYPALSYGAGFISGSGMCENCDAALPAKDMAAEHPDTVTVPRELLEELRAFTLEYDSGRAGVLRGGIDALLREEGEQ